MTHSIPLSPALEALIRLFYPARCAGCHALLALPQKNLCSPCQESLEHLRFSLWDQPLGSNLPAAVSEAWSLYRYQGLTQTLLGDYKYEGFRDILQIFKPEVEEFGRVLAGFRSYEAVVPVPADPGRREERDFAPVKLLADLVARSLRIPCRERLLVKTRRTLPQAALSREERRVNLSESFQARPKVVSGRTLLLVDDILTTGATASEAAATLRRAGAKRVDLWTLARTELSS